MNDFLTKEQQEKLKEPFKNLAMVVRCKDCKYGDWAKNMKGEDMVSCINTDAGIVNEFLHNSDWFCADGEPKD